MKITDENLADMIDAAGYGVTYWARSASAEQWSAHPGARLVLVERETGRVLAVTDAQLRAAFRALAATGQQHVGPQVAGYFREAVRNADADGIDAGEIDSDAGDCLVQLAALGSIVYG
jgi:hypothetical protein